MKVIKRGREQKGWAKEYVCTGMGNGLGGCGAILLVEQLDLFYMCSFHKDEADYRTNFECPECGVKTVVKDCPISSNVLPSYNLWKAGQTEQ